MQYADVPTGMCTLTRLPLSCPQLFQVLGDPFAQALLDFVHPLFLYRRKVLQKRALTHASARSLSSLPPLSCPPSSPPRPSAPLRFPFLLACSPPRTPRECKCATRNARRGTFDFPLRPGAHQGKETPFLAGKFPIWILLGMHVRCCLRCLVGSWSASTTAIATTLPCSFVSCLPPARPSPFPLSVHGPHFRARVVSRALVQHGLHPEGSRRRDGARLDHAHHPHLHRLRAACFGTPPRIAAPSEPTPSPTSSFSLCWESGEKTTSKVYQGHYTTLCVRLGSLPHPLALSAAWEGV